jgi:hypothetical protein
VFNQIIEQSNFFFITIAQTIRWLRSSQWFALMLYSHYVGVRRESISLSVCRRSLQWFAFILYTYTHTYIYKKLFMHVGLNNSELISTRGAILTKWSQKQRKRITILTIIRDSHWFVIRIHYSYLIRYSFLIRYSHSVVIYSHWFVNRIRYSHWFAFILYSHYVGCAWIRYSQWVALNTYEPSINPDKSNLDNL